MDLCIRLPKALGISANRESLFSGAARQQLAVALAAVLGPSEQWQPQEIELYRHFAGGPGQPLAAGEGRGVMIKALRECRLLLKGVEADLSCYKNVFFAALLSRRRDEQLVDLVAQGREVLAIEDFHAGLVADATLRATGTLYPPDLELSREEKCCILALIVRLLRVDGGEHLRERASVRLAMVVMEAAADQAQGLGDYLTLSTAALWTRLSDGPRSVAWLNLLRVAAADGLLNRQERALLIELQGLGGVSPVSMRRIVKQVSLESGRVLSLPD